MNLDDVIRRHSPPVGEILRARHARFEENPAEQRSSKEILIERGYVPHDAATAFDDAYGGLVMAGEEHTYENEPLSATWSFDDTAGWMFGPSACLLKGGHSSPKGDQDFLEFYGDDVLQLVPVAYGISDDIMYVDAVGRGYFHDTCYEVGGPHLFASEPEQLFARIVLSSWCMTTRLRFGCKGHRGASIADALELPLLGDASGEDERWWGEGTTVVVETITLPCAGAGPVARVTNGATAEPEVAERMKQLFASKKTP